MKHDNAVYIIAEAGVNHNGDIQRAMEMIDAAAASGADCVKFQTFLPDALVSKNAEKAAYQQRNAPSNDSQQEMLTKLALSFEQHHLLVSHCKKRGIDFLSSPFDRRSADFLLNDLKLDTIKLGSGELTNGPLLWQVAASGASIILSTGMASQDEIIETLGLLCLAYTQQTPTKGQNFSSEFKKGILDSKVTLLHCTTSYPCPLETVNLKAMNSLAKLSGLCVGYSDHTEGINISLAAVARGARIIEKHFTLDKNLEGPDHAASIEPKELVALVSGVRQISQALGAAEKIISQEESEIAKVARKGLVATKPIKNQEKFNTGNITSKRPQTGLSPMRYWDVLGEESSQDYQEDESISLN